MWVPRVTVPVAALVLLGGCASSLIGAPFRIEPGSTHDRAAGSLAAALPGEGGDPAQVRRVLALALAAPDLAAASAALARFDLSSAAAALSRARFGREGALAPVAAWRELPWFEPDTVDPRPGLPPPLDDAAFRAYRARLGERLGALAGGLPPSPPVLEAWLAEAAREARREWPGDRLPAPVLGYARAPLRALAELLPARPGHGAPPAEGPPARALVDAYRASAWARRATLEILAGHGRAEVGTLAEVVEDLELEVRVRLAPGVGREGVVVSLAGGRLGSMSPGPDGALTFTVPWARAGKLVAERDVLPLQVVRDRGVVYSRDLPLALFLSPDLPRVGSPRRRLLDLGAVEATPARGAVRVRVPDWDGFRGDPPDTRHPVSGLVRVAGAAAPRPLEPDGTARFPRLSPGVVLVVLEVRDEAGTLEDRSLATGVLEPGEELDLELPLPSERVEPVTPSTSLERVRTTMEGLAARYRTGVLSRSAFHRSIGEVFRAHRGLHDDPREDREFAREVSQTMRGVMLGIQEDQAGLRVEERLDALAESLEDLRAVLPSLLQDTPRPAARLEGHVEASIREVFAPAPSDDLRSVPHLEALARRAEDAATELTGILTLLRDVLPRRLEGLRSELIATLGALEADQALVRLNRSGSLEDRALEVVEDGFLPVVRLLDTAGALARQRISDDLRARVEGLRQSTDAQRELLASRREAEEGLRREAEADRERASRAAGPGRTLLEERPGTTAWLKDVARAAEDPGALRGALEACPLGPPEVDPWPVGVGVRAADLAALEGAAAALERARAARVRHEDFLRTHLLDFFELATPPEELAALAALHASERREVVQAALPRVRAGLSLEPLSAPPWPEPESLAAVGAIRAALAGYLREEPAVAAWNREAMEVLSGVLEEAPSADAAGLTRLREVLEGVSEGAIPRAAPPAPFHGGAATPALVAWRERVRGALESRAEVLDPDAVGSTATTTAP